MKKLIISLLVLILLIIAKLFSGCLPEQTDTNNGKKKQIGPDTFPPETETLIKTKPDSTGK